MFEHIVVGCDGSQATREAIALAEQLRAPQRGKLILVSVFPFYRSYAVTPPLHTEWLRERAEADLGVAGRWVTDGVPYESQTIASASTVSGLDEVAESVGADLIVIGASHHGAAGRATGRTTVQRMLHGAPCALAVSARAQHHRLDAGGWITVAYDDSPESRFALSVAYDIASVSRSRVRICTALEPLIYGAGLGGPVPGPTYDREREQAARDRLSELVADAPRGLDVETRLRRGSPADVVLDLAGDDTGLIVAGSRGYGPVRRVLAGGVSARLLVNADIPVLVTPRTAVREAEKLAAVTIGTSA